MDERKGQAKQLWKRCFADSDAFVDLYFDLRYSDDITDTIEEDNRVVSALQRIPYPMTYAGSRISTAYISGACTHPDYRSRGLMRQLLQTAHRRMYADGVALSTLIPAEGWLHEYYGQSGYTDCFQQGVEIINTFQQAVNNDDYGLSFNEIDLSKPINREAYAFFDEQLSKRDYCVQHTAKDLNIVLADLHLSGGSLWSASHGELLTTLAFCLPESDEELLIEELLTTDAETEQALLVQLASHYRTHRIKRLVRFGKENHQLGMARIINAEHLLQLYAHRHPQTNMAIEVTNDSTLPQNNGYYLLQAGACLRPSSLPIPPQHTFTIKQLATFLFEGTHPYMSLMMN